MSKLYKNEMECQDTGTTISNIDGYIAAITKLGLGNDCILFRGQSHDWKLSPNIQRIRKRQNSTNRCKSLYEIEKECLRLFKLRATPHIQDFYPENDWHWISLAQHHRLVTRLIDWTINPLVALWFATQPRDPGQNLSPIVYVYTPSESDFVTPEEFEGSPFDLDQSIAKVFEPKHVVKRVSAQQSFFTIHGNPVADFYADLGNCQEIRIDAAGENIVNLRAALDRLGINESTIYADLDGLAGHIIWLNSFVEDEF